MTANADIFNARLPDQLDCIPSKGSLMLNHSGDAVLNEMFGWSQRTMSLSFDQDHALATKSCRRKGIMGESKKHSCRFGIGFVTSSRTYGSISSYYSLMSLPPAKWPAVPESHHSVSLQGARLVRRHSRTSRGTVRRRLLQRAGSPAVMPVCSARTGRPV
jgi:hypothetical protein